MTKELVMAFRPDRLIEARENAEWTQEELGRRAGTSQKHISAIESGKVAPASKILANLVRTFREGGYPYSADWFLGETDNPYQNPTSEGGDNPIAYLGFSKQAYRAAQIINELDLDDQLTALRLTESLGRELALRRGKPPAPG